MDVSITGPKVYLRITKLYEQFEGTMVDIFGNFGNLITQTTVSLLAVTILLMIVARIATRKIEKRPGAVQVLVEKVLGMLYDLVEQTMGKHNLKFAPYIGTLFLSCMIGSLIGTTGLFRSTTADFSVTLAYALVTSGLVWYHNIKANGFHCIHHIVGAVECGVALVFIAVIQACQSGFQIAHHQICSGGIIGHIVKNLVQPIVCAIGAVIAGIDD